MLCSLTFLRLKNTERQYPVNFVLLQSVCDSEVGCLPRLQKTLLFWKNSWVGLVAGLLIVGRKFHTGLLSKGTDMLVPNYVLKDGLYSTQPWNGAGFSLCSRGQVCFLSRIIKIISSSGVKVEQAYYCPIRSYLNPEFLSHGCVCWIYLDCFTNSSHGDKVSWQKHGAQTDHCAMSNKVLCLWPRGLVSSVGIYEPDGLTY